METNYRKYNGKIHIQKSNIQDCNSKDHKSISQIQSQQCWGCKSKVVKNLYLQYTTSFFTHDNTHCWNGANGHKNVQHSSYQSMTCLGKPADPTHFLWLSVTVFLGISQAIFRSNIFFLFYLFSAGTSASNKIKELNDKVWLKC